MGFQDTDRLGNMKAYKPDIVVIDKVAKEWFIIDVARPFDTRVSNREREKLDKYQDLKKDMKRIWHFKKITVVIRL